MSFRNAKHVREFPNSSAGVLFRNRNWAMKHFGFVAVAVIGVALWACTSSAPMAHLNARG